MEGEDYAKRAERVKALLSSYYGVTESQLPPPGTPGQASRGDESSLATRSVHDALPAMDSPAYNVDVHSARMLRTLPLEKLMVEHRSMSREIKNLDSDMQQLVYENYNKFISATDTIRAMKSNMEGMTTEMDKLKTITDVIADKSSSVSLKLARRQDHMDQLHRVQQLLRKLQAVFDLPKKMRAALDEDAYDTAVSFYAEAQPLLKKYGARGTFRQIAAESDVLAREIVQVLKRRLTERKDDTEQCVLLLRKLGEPDDTLMDKYLQGRSQRLRKLLKEAGAVVDILSYHYSGLPVPAELTKAVESSKAWGLAGADGKSAVPGIKAFVKSLDEKVINAVQETVKNMLHFFLSDDQVAGKRKPLVNLAKDVFNEYFKIVRRALADYIAHSVAKASKVREAAEEQGFSAEGPHMDFAFDWGGDALAQALALLSADLSLLHNNLLELNLRDRAADLVSSCVRHHVGACFRGLQARVVGAISVLRVQLGDTAGQQQQGQVVQPSGLQSLVMSSAGRVDTGPQLLRRAYGYLQEVVQRGLQAVLQGLKAYESHLRLMSSWHAEFVDCVQSGLGALFTGMLTHCLDVARMRYDGSDLLREVFKAQQQLQQQQATVARLSGSGAPPAPSLGATAATAFSETSPSLQLPKLLDPATAAATSASTAENKDQPKTGLVLLLSKLCLHLEQQSVPWVMETIAASFVASRGPGSGGGAGRADLPPAFVPGEVARRLSAASSSLISAYVELHGRQLSLMVRRSVAATSWLQHREPRGPRQVCDLMLERLGRAEAEVVQLVEDAGGRARPEEGAGRLSGVTRNLDAGLALETGNVERGVARLFREKVQIFGSVQFNQGSILGGIIGVGLKSMVECIRLQTLGRAGLQQLQLDCHYLRPQLRRFTGGGGRTADALGSLLDEIVAAGAERCVDTPNLLELSVMDRILANADQQ